MKNILKNLMAAGTIASFAIAPIVAFAETGATIKLNTNTTLGGSSVNGSMNASANARADATFCDFIKDKSVDDFKKWDARMNMDDRREDRDGVIAGIRAKFDDKREDKNGEREQKFNDLISKWEANAKTEAELSAIAQFKTELHAAIDTRQTATGEAVADAREKRDEVRAETRAKMDAAVAEFKDDVSAALDEAQKDCNNGVSSATVRTNFAADVKVATDEFKKAMMEIKADAKIEAGDVRDERKDAMTESRAEFRGFWENLRARFQAIFGMRAKGEIEVQ